MFRPINANELHQKDIVFFVHSANSEAGQEIPEGTLGTVECLKEHSAIIRLQIPMTATANLTDALGPHRSANSVGCIAIAVRDGKTFMTGIIARVELPKPYPHTKISENGCHSWNAPDGAVDALAADGRYRKEISHS